jgi:hypothetical protein
MQQQYSNSLRLIPTKHSHVFDVTLQLDHQTRHIGRIDEAGEGVFYSKRSEKHIHRKTNSLGLNLELVQRQDLPFKWIIIEFDGRKLVTSREFLLYHGSVFNFSKAGFEKQVFLKLDYWGEQKARDFERTLCKQQELFSLEAA